jgi:hypothetical protein
MALGETQVMAATKRALADDGVDVAKLEAAAAAAGAGSAANKALPRSSASAAELEVRAVPAGAGSGNPRGAVNRGS